MKDVLNKLFEYKSLSKQEAKDILLKISKGDVNTSHVTAFITVFLMRTITVNELAGFREAMLEICIPVDLSGYDAIDVCGTGGDGKNTFNISTISAFVAAASGVKVAKHGNYAVSSSSGSSNVLEKAGVKFSADPRHIIKSLEECNIGILHAPLFHPAMKNMGPIRKELGMKTFFNILGPTINPSQPKKQLSGVYNLELARLYGHLFHSVFERYAIIHSLDGYDEISLTSEFKMITHENECLKSPESLKLKKRFQEDLFGGTSVAEAFEVFKKILEGNGTEAQNDVVAANAGAAIWVSENNRSLESCIETARESLVSKKAKGTFEKFLALNS